MTFFLVISGWLKNYNDSPDSSWPKNKFIRISKLFSIKSKQFFALLTRLK